VQRAGRSTLILVLGGAALFVDMFLHWTRVGGLGGNLSGWQLPVMNQAGLVVLTLEPVEATRIHGVWRTPTSGLLGCLLGAATGILVVSGLINLHWGYPTGLKFSRYGYGAWIALALALVVLFGAWSRLEEGNVVAAS
jgi:hypothetical protein